MRNNANITLLKANTGALFGIDARIALVIFAALAMGIGYFAVDKIAQARTAAFIKELQNIEQGVAGLQTDLGSPIRYGLTAQSNGLIDFEALYMKERIKDGLKKYWNGPYFSQRLSREHPQFGSYSLVYGNAERNECKDYKTPCYTWLKLSDVPEDLWVRVNDYIDGYDEKNPERQGRIMADSLSDVRGLFYRLVADKQR